MVKNNHLKIISGLINQVLPNDKIMKNYILLLLLFTLPHVASAQKQTSSYDSTLAAKLGADEYGMKNYILVILKTGPNTRTDKSYVDSCFAGHMANIQKLVNEGKLVVAGPIKKNDKNYRGIFILNMASFDEAIAAMSGDAAITERLLEPEMYKWYGSAALPEYIPASEKIRKTKF